MCATARPETTGIIAGKTRKWKISSRQNSETKEANCFQVSAEHCSGGLAHSLEIYGAKLLVGVT